MGIFLYRQLKPSKTSKNLQHAPSFPYCLWIDQLPKWPHWLLFFIKKKKEKKYNFAIPFTGFGETGWYFMEKSHWQKYKFFQIKSILHFIQWFAPICIVLFWEIITWTHRWVWPCLKGLLYICLPECFTLVMFYMGIWCYDIIYDRMYWKA